MGSGRRYASTSEEDNAEYLGTRMRIIRSLNPYMADRPDAMLAMAQTDLSPEQLVDQSAQMYGMMTGTRFADQLHGMTPAAQRGIWARLPRVQQMALEGVGYQPDTRDEGFFEDLIGDVAGAAGKLIGGGLTIASKVGGPVVSDVILPGLEWVGNWPGHLYRSIRLMDGEQQWLGLAGALVGGAAAFALAPVTGGGSLAVLGAIGGGALLGGTAGAAVTAPMDWWRAFDDSWEGERTFERGARRRADELLGDPRLIGLAEDLALVEGMTIDDLAVDLAAMGQGVTEPGAFAAFNELASRMGVEGSPEYQTAFRAMVNAFSIPAFREAVETLQNGKISPGRDVADAFGIEPGTGLYNGISGIVDLSFTLAVDPILMTGIATKLRRVHRLGVKMVDGAPLTTSLAKVFAKPSVRQLHEEVVTAINGTQGVPNVLRLRQIAPEYERALPEVVDHLATLRRTKQIAEDAPLTVDILQDYLKGTTQLSPILRGIGNVRSGERILIRDWQPYRQHYREFASTIRSFVHGMGDPAMEREWIERAQKAVDEGKPHISQMIPAGMVDHLTKEGLLDTPWLWNEVNPRAAAAGRRLGQVLPDWLPVGRAIDIMTTMAPAGYAIALTGDNAPSQIRAMTEMGTFFGMPSWARRYWADTMLASPSTAVRQELAIGWLDNAMTIAGGRNAAELAEWTELFLTKSRQRFGFDDVIEVAGVRRHVGMLSSHNADEIVMPSLKQIRKAAMTGTMARLVGIGDLNVFEASVNKIWKPAVLLRLAFIPRAIGEEALAFFLRSGVGGVGQQWAARSIGERNVYDSAAEKMRTGRAVELTEGEQRAWAGQRNARLPAHVRVVQRILDHTDWRDPSYRHLERYGDFLRDTLAKGIGKEKERFVPGQPRTVPRPETGFRVQLADNRNQLLMGNKYSWRRMIAGGVDNELVDAATEWASLHRTSMMRALSTTNTGALENNTDPRHVEVRQILDSSTGKLRNQEYQNIPGERQISTVGEESYDGNYHRALAEVLESDLDVAVFQRHVALIKGNVKLTDEQIYEILRPLQGLPAPVRGIINEFLSAPNRDTFNAMINWLGSRYPSLAETLKMLPNLRTVDFGELVKHVDEYRRGVDRPWEAELEAARSAPAADIVDADVVEPEWFREILDDKMLTTEALRQRALDRRAALESDPDPDDLDWGARPDINWEAIDPVLRSRRTGDVDDVDDGWEEHPVPPWGDWTTDQRGQIVLPDGTSAPKRIAQLEAEHARAVEYEEQVREIRFNTDEAEIKAYRTERLDQHRLEVDTIANELLAFGGGNAAIDPRTHKVVFYGLKPRPTPEWEWWRQLSPGTRKALAMRYFRNSGLPPIPLDVIADRLGLTVDEWAEKFLELTRTYDRVRVDASVARKANRRAWRQRYEEEQITALDPLDPGRPAADIGGELAETRQAREQLTEARRRAAMNRSGQTDADPSAEPTPVVLPSRAEVEEERLQTLAERGPLGLDESPEPATPLDPKARRAADRALRDRPPIELLDQMAGPDDEWLAGADLTEWDELTYQVEAAPETLDDFYRLLKQAQPSIEQIQSLSDYERGFVGQLVRGMSRPGSGFRLGDLRRAVEGDGASPFYRSFDEARDHIKATYTSEALNPHRNEASEAMLRLLDDSRNPTLTGSTVQLFQAPSFRGPRKWAEANGRTFGYDDILGAASNKRVIVDNRDVVEGLLKVTDPERLPAIANLELARELRHIDSRLKHGGDVMAQGDVIMVPMPREVLDGRWHDGDGLIPVVARQNKGVKETQVWALKSSMYRHRFTPLPRSAAARAEEYAQDRTEEIRKLFTRNTTSWKKARERTLRDGTKAPLVYLRGPDGATRPVTPDMKITHQDRFLDKYGQPIANEDTAFWEFGGGEADAQGDPVWEALGALMEDMWDSRGGGVRLLPKQKAAFASGRVVESTDSVRVYRSKVEHVGRIGDGRPQAIWGQKMVPVQTSTWDRFVRWGFDKVIGGSIDAIARRPMAFHYFQQRYIENMRLTQWMTDPALAQQMEELKRSVVAKRGEESIPNAVMADTARRVAAHHGAPATVWTDHEALAWLRAQNVDDLGTMLKSAVIYGRNPAHRDKELAAGAAALLRAKPARVLTAVETEATPQQFLKFIESQLPPGALNHAAELRTPAARKQLEQHPTLQHITDKEWDVILAFASNQRHIRAAAGQAAAIGAINDMVPFIDSHEFKTQFAEYGRGFLPFWYAEENFMKRWIRGLADAGPAFIRRAQLGYMGLKEAGVVRTDQNGKDWFVYPGSTLLADAISAIHPTLGLAAGGIMFQTPTDAMLPGVNNRFGAPAFNPLVTLPVEFAGALFPELKPIETALSGPYGDKGVIETIVPSTLTNMFNSVLTDERTNERYGAAMFAAMAQLDATNNGLSPTATAGQRDEYMRRIREHARIIVVAQSLMSFVSPGPPSPVNAGVTGNLVGLGISSPAEIFSSSYLELVRGLGIEEGTIKYLELYKDANLFDVINPLAYTQGRAESSSGAQLGSTTNALEWYSTNSDYLDELPNAGPWLLPQEYLDGRRSEHAYDTQMVAGLRRRLSPDDFLTGLKFKEAAYDYFKARDLINDAISKAEMNNDPDRVRVLKQRWETWSGNYRATHPIFDQELSGGDGRQRRQAVIAEMRVAVADPQAPASPRLDDMRTIMNVYDAYRTRLMTLSDDRSARGRAKVEALKARYTRAMDMIVRERPKLASFWTSVLRPESSLN